MSSTTPLLHPEQERALAYLARKGSAATAATLAGELEHAFGSLEAILAALPPPARAWSPAPGKWSPHEILDHLVVSHEPAVDQLAALLRGETPAGVAIPAGLQTAAAERASWEQLQARLARVHRHLVTLVQTAGDEPSLIPSALVEMVVKVPDADGVAAPVHWHTRLDWKAFVQAIRVHTLEHRNQLQRLLAERG